MLERQHVQGAHSEHRRLPSCLRPQPPALPAYLAGYRPPFSPGVSGWVSRSAGADSELMGVGVLAGTWVTG